MFITTAMIGMMATNNNGPAELPGTDADRTIKIQLVIDGLVDKVLQKKIDDLIPFYLDKNGNYTDDKSRDIETKEIVRLSLSKTTNTVSIKIIAATQPQSYDDLKKQLKELCDACGKENIIIYLYISNPAKK